MKKLSKNVSYGGNRHFNFFAVGRRKGILLECGVTGAAKQFVSQMGARPESPDVRSIVAMHAHFDHVCGIPTLQEHFPGATLLASVEARSVLSKSKVLRQFYEQDRKVSDFFCNEGIMDHCVLSPQIDHIDVDETLGEGDRLEVDDGLMLEFLETPGHSPCSLSAYLPADQVLFVSDACGFQISDAEIFPTFFESYDRYIDSIRRLMGFPARVLALPHEQIWQGDDVESFFRRALDAARSVRDWIQDALEAGEDEKTTENELFTEFYRGYLRMYTPENIRTCVRLLQRRVRETL
jgi:glyoxylase-like metal-dependent hydrolase (beta-lactamase superfamily II)